MSFGDDLEQAKAVLASGKTFSYKGVNYSRTRLRDELIPSLEILANIEVAEEKRSAKIASNKKQQISQAESDLKIKQGRAKRDLTAFNKKNLSESELAKSEQDVRDAQQKLNNLRGIKTEPVAATRPTDTTSDRSKRGVGQVQGPPSPFLDADGKPIKVEPGAADSAAVVAKPKTVTKAEVDAALASSGLADTPDNRKKVRADLEAGTKPQGGAKPQADWETLVAEQAGEYAYLLDPQYEGVPELLRKAVQEGYFKSDEGKLQFIQEFKNTGYYRNTSQKQQLFDKRTPADKKVAIQTEVDRIRAEYGEIQFDQAGLEEVAGVAARNGASTSELGRLVYRAAFKRGSVAPDFTKPVAAKTALGGQDADRIRSIYRAYGQRADDQMISRILAGDSDPASGVVMTEDMLRTNLRDIAKVSYSPFSDLLDRGVSIETIFSPYQNIAASILEKPRDQISLLTNDGVPTEFASALSGDKPKSLNDWISELKRNPKYNYQFTSAANAEVSSMVSTLEKAFGFRQ